MDPAGQCRAPGHYRRVHALVRADGKNDGGEDRVGPGVLGILSFFIRDNFLVATVIGASLMLFMMGVGHVIDLKKNKNFSPYNAGSVIWFDLLVPVAMVALLVLWKAGY